MRKNVGSQAGDLYRGLRVNAAAEARERVTEGGALPRAESLPMRGDDLLDQGCPRPRHADDKDGTRISVSRARALDHSRPGECRDRRIDEGAMLLPGERLESGEQFVPGRPMTKRTGMLVLARPEFRQIIVSHDRV